MRSSIRWATANGTYVGAPQTGVTGLLTGDPDTGVSFNGTSQYADVPAAAAWTPPAFSIELSVRPSELPVNKTIWSTQGAFTGWWLNTDSTGEVRLFVGDGSGWRFDDSGPVLSAGSTYHLAATYDGTNARLYVNGALVSTGPNVTMAPAAASVMRFGAFSTGPGQYWPGVLDEASFFPFALSSSQVQAHYSASVTGSQATSAATGVVTSAAPVNTSVPVVSGVAQVGQTLSASTGSWSGTSPISYAYRWQRCSPGCVDISGATASSYAAVAADVGATLRAVVTASNSAGSSEAASAQTAAVIAAGEVTVTFSVTAGGDDGDVSVAGNQPGGYPPAGTPAVNTTNSIFTAGRRLAFGRYQIMQALLRFDTSSLPDNATVTSAKLRLSVTGRTDGDDRSLVGEWYDPSTGRSTAPTGRSTPAQPQSPEPTSPPSPSTPQSSSPSPPPPTPPSPATPPSDSGSAAAYPPQTTTSSSQHSNTPPEPNPNSSSPTPRAPADRRRRRTRRCRWCRGWRRWDRR